MPPALGEGSKLNWSLSNPPYSDSCLQACRSGSSVSHRTGHSQGAVPVLPSPEGHLACGVGWGGGRGQESHAGLPPACPHLWALAAACAVLRRHQLGAGLEWASGPYWPLLSLLLFHLWSRALCMSGTLNPEASLVFAADYEGAG